MHDQEHYRRIGAMGGRTTHQRHPHHLQTIARAGWDACVRKHDHGTCLGHAKAKGWRGRKQANIAVDLAAGRVDAALAA